MESVNEPWKDIAKKAQAYRDASFDLIDPPVPELEASLPLNVTAIPKQVLSEVEISITEMLTEDLVASLSSGKLSSMVVTQAFLRRAVVAQKLVSCNQHTTYL
jgi:amidase